MTDTISNICEAILFPIIYMMEKLLEVYISFLPSAGIAILTLSVTMALLTWPLQRYGGRIELRQRERMQVITEQVARLDKGLRGEARFNAVDAIYQNHNYHPISNVLLGFSFLVQIPVLLSAIFLLTQTAAIENQPFLFVSDLSNPDGFLGISGFSINILPLGMFLITFIDAKIRYAKDRSAQRRFILISVVLLFLIYPFPAGLILYWIGSNLSSFALYTIRQFRTRRSAPRGRFERS